MANASSLKHPDRILTFTVPAAEALDHIEKDFAGIGYKFSRAKDGSGGKLKRGSETAAWLVEGSGPLTALMASPRIRKHLANANVVVTVVESTDASAVIGVGFNRLRGSDVALGPFLTELDGIVEQLRTEGVLASASDLTDTAS